MNRILLLGLLVAALLVRVYRLTEPPLDFHQMRQYIGATVARDFYFTGNDAIAADRRDLAHFTKEHTELLEPQVLPTLATWGYRLAGGERLWIPRLISALSWLLGGIFLWRIASRAVGPTAALCALTFFLFMPYAIMASRTFQPDALAWMLTLWAVWRLLRHAEEPTSGNLIFAVAVTLAGMVVRPMCILFVFPVFFFLQWERRGFWRGAFHWQTWLMALVPLLPPAAFYLYGLSRGEFIRDHSSFTFMPKLFRESYYWLGWADKIGRTVGWLPALAGLASAVWLARGKFRTLLLGLWAGYLCYGLIFNYHIHTHDYYSMPLIPIVALSLAPLAEILFARLARLWAQRRGALVGATALVLVGALAVAVVGKKVLRGHVSRAQKDLLKQSGALVGFNKKILSFLGRDDQFFHHQIKDFVEIGAAVGHSRRTILLSEDYGKALIYHGELFGVCWPPQSMSANIKRTGARIYGPDILETPDDFEALKQRAGAEFLIVTELLELERQPALAAHVAAHYQEFKRGERYVIYRLTP
jgi:hypothetical protein